MIVSGTGASVKLVAMRSRKRNVGCFAHPNGRARVATAEVGGALSVYGLRGVRDRG